MFSFLLSFRLARLSRSIISCTFPKGEYDREELKDAGDAMYMDMLEYREEHPGASYREILYHFADEEARLTLAQQFRRRCLITAAIACFLIVILLIALLPPVLTFFVYHTPISYYKFHH